MYLRLIFLLCSVQMFHQLAGPVEVLGKTYQITTREQKSLKSITPYIRTITNPLKAFVKPIISKIQLAFELMSWYNPELDLGACIYETYTGHNPLKAAREFAKNIVKSAFAKMVSPAEHAPPPTLNSYPVQYPVYLPSAPSQPTFDSGSATYYVRRHDIIEKAPVTRLTPVNSSTEKVLSVRRVPSTRLFPTIQSSQSYSRVHRNRKRETRQFYEKDEHFQWQHKPVTVVHPPGSYYLDYNPAPAYSPPPNPLAPLLRQEWVDYFENLLLSKFGLVERLKESNYVNCAQSYTFVVTLRMLANLLSRLF